MRAPSYSKRKTIVEQDVRVLLSRTQRVVDVIRPKATKPFCEVDA
jgi:hypothetical protein